MSVEAKKVTIGDKDYQITQFTTGKGLKYLKQISSIVGPTFARLVGEKDALTGADVDSDAISEAVEILVENMDKENVEELIQNLVAGVVYSNGQPINFDMDFAGEYGALFNLVLEVVKFNYSSVFSSGAFGLDALASLQQ